MSNQSFDQIYLDYKDKLIKVTRDKVLDKDEAEDIVQEVFIKIHNNLHSYDSKYALSTWIYSILFNTIKTYYRSKDRSLPITAIEDMDDLFPASLDSPENNLIAEQTSKDLNKKYLSMNKDFLEVYKLKEQGMSIKDISSALNVMPNTVKTRLHRANSFLKSL